MVTWSGQNDLALHAYYSHQNSWHIIAEDAIGVHLEANSPDVVRIMRVATKAKQRDDGAIRDIDRIGNTAFFYRRDIHRCSLGQIVDADKFLEKGTHTVKQPLRTFPCNNNWIICNDDTQLFVTHIFCLVPGRGMDFSLSGIASFNVRGRTKESVPFPSTISLAVTLSLSSTK